MLNARRVLVLLALLAISGSLLITITAVMNSVITSTPGLEIEIYLGDRGASKALLVFYQVTPVYTPDVHEHEFAVVKEGSLEPRYAIVKIRVPAEGMFKNILDGFLRKYQKLVSTRVREEFIKRFGESLLVDLWLIDKSSGNIVCRYTATVTYNPLEVSRGLIKKQLSINWDLCGELAKVSTPVNIYSQASALKTPPQKILASTEVVGNNEYLPLNGGYLIIRWRVNNTLKPENLTYNPSYIKVVNGVWYLKTPIYIFNNTHPLSSVMDTYISIGALAQSGFYVTVGFGSNLISNAAQGIISTSDIVLYKAGSSVLRVAEGGWDFPYHYADNASFYYIWTRPVIRFVQEELCYCEHGVCYCDLTGNEKVEGIVEDFLVNDNVYDGGWEWITSDHWINYLKEVYFNATLSQKQYFTTLNSTRYYFYFTELYTWINVCNQGWQISVNPGAVISTILTATNPAAVPVAYRFLSMLLTLNFGYEESSSLMVFGQVIVANYTYPEYIYVSLNRFTYKQGSCSYQVPIVFYIESH